MQVESCSLTGNLTLIKDYVWTCQYMPLNSGCCESGDSCDDGSLQGDCTGAGAIWHRNASCSDVVACRGGCCKYKDGTSAGGVTMRECTLSNNRVAWSLGSCPPAPQCIPEPGAILLALTGFGAAGYFLRHRRVR